MPYIKFLFLTLTAMFVPAPVFASAGMDTAKVLHIETHPGAIFCLAVFVLSYIAVLFEELTHLRKSKPVMLGAGIIWLTIGLVIYFAYSLQHSKITEKELIIQPD